MAKKNDRPLTEKQLEELGRALREKRDALRARQKDIDEERVFEIEPDPMDMATDVIAGNEGDALIAHDSFLLAQIESALSRLAAGTYGLSEESGEPIPYARLRLIPWARRTADEEAEAAESANAQR